jgi:hypothetical protein
MSQLKHARPSNAKRVAAVAGTGAVVAVPSLFVATSANAAPAPAAIPTTSTVAPAQTDTPTAPAACEDYIVNRGDTLSSIAARYGVPLADLEAKNPGVIAGSRPDDYSLIFRGGHVHLPAGHCTPAPVGKHGQRHKPVRVWYRNCSAVPAGTNLRRGDPGYRPALDRDGDGKACEHGWHTTPSEPPTPPVTAPPVSTGTTPVIAPDCPGTSSGYCAHSVSFWAPLIEQAMGLVGGNVNANHNVSAVESLMLSESSGDPNAINNYDSNAQNGDPSRGLMQTIGATFNAYHVAGTSTNIYDPLANIAAALNYINAVYGGVIPNSPY